MKAPALKVPAPPDHAEIEKEAAQRLQQSRRQKAMFEGDIRECYYFARPHRERGLTSQGSGDSRPDSTGELSTSLALEVKQDFATEIENTFLSPTQPWAAREVGPDLRKKIGDAAAKELETDVQEDDKLIFQAVGSSNFYGALAMSMDPDIAIGTMAMWIEDLRPSEPVVCQAIPLRELEIDVGPYGDVDTRFVVRSTRYRFLPALLPNIALPKDIADKVKAKGGNDKCEVRWGFWRDWSDPAAGVVWKHVVMVGAKVVHQAELKGPGSCPLIVARWNPDPMFAFGEGPLIASLSELRQLDEMRALSIERVGFAVHPPWTYPDDGELNFDGGIQEGMGYPMRGSGKMQALFVEGDLDAGFIEEQATERRIRRLHFVDRPEQRGDTPPTATQWLDELERSQRKIGTPGAAFFREGPAEFFMRFQHILEKRGTIDPIQIDGKGWALSPVNPAKRAQDTQEIQIAMKLIEIANMLSPQLAQVVIDQNDTLAKIKAKLHDTIVTIRSKDELQAAVEQFAPLLGGGGGGAAGGTGGSGAPAAPGAPPA